MVGRVLCYCAVCVRFIVMVFLFDFGCSVGRFWVFVREALEGY